MRQLTEAMRAATADPPPTTIDLDEILVRARRRRTALGLLAAAAAVVVAAGTAPVIAAVARPVAEPAPPPLAGPARSPDRPEVSGQPAPPDVRAWTTAAEVAAADALPDGYRMGEPPIEYWAVEYALMWADVRHPDGRRSQLHIYLDRLGDAAPQDDVCALPHPGMRFSGEEVSCDSIEVAGVTLRVSTSRDVLREGADPFEFTLVSQYREGSAVHLWELPYPHPMYEHDDNPELVDGPVLTTRQLAELALHPALAAPELAGASGADPAE